MTFLYPDLGNASDWLKLSFIWNYQKHFPDLGSGTLPVWNLFTCYSDAVLRGNQWCCHEMSAFFSGYKESLLIANVKIELYSFCQFSGVFWCCMVARLYWWTVLWCWGSFKSCGLFGHNGIWWTESDQRRLHSKGKFTSKSNNTWYILFINLL